MRIDPKNAAVILDFDNYKNIKYQQQKFKNSVKRSAEKIQSKKKIKQIDNSYLYETYSYELEASLLTITLAKIGIYIRFTNTTVT